MVMTMQRAGNREVAIYAAVVAAAAATLAWRGYTYSLSFEKGGAWQGYAPGLQQGWLWGRSVDLSDIQWRDFLGGLPALCVAFAIFVCASRLAQHAQRAQQQRQLGSGGGRGGAHRDGGYYNGSEGGGDATREALAQDADRSSNCKSGQPQRLACNGLGDGPYCGASLRQALCLAFSAAFLGYLHGACAVLPVGIASANYLLAHKVAGKRHGGLLVWGSNIAALLAARVWDGISFGSISPALAALVSHRGFMRWEVCFNLSLLRMLSFSLDLHWRAQRARQARQAAQLAQQDRLLDGALDGAQQAQQAAPGCQQLQLEDHKEEEKHKASTKSSQQQSQHQYVKQQQSQHSPSHAASMCPGEATARWRQATPLPSGDDYGLVTYLSYVFYPPLYLAGPILTFQDFTWQLRQPVRLPRAQLLRYAARFAADWACLEAVTHTLYFNSIAKHRVGLRYSHYGLQYGPMEAALTGFWVLTFMWLKFATIWRFFRLVALLEGIVPPDNMRRCFANNYDVEGFWRGWHSSYNAWLVRYMYIPLGGSQWRLLNIWPIFLFVALWHDLEWRLLGWALLVCLAFTPELLVKRAAASPRLAGWRPAPSYRHVAATLAALNIAGLIAANLAGFVLGTEGLMALAPALLRQPGMVAATLAVFYSAAQLMFWLRAQEAAGRAVEA